MCSGCRYNQLPTVNLQGEDWETYIRMNINSHVSTLKDHPQLQTTVLRAENGVIWGKTAEDPGSEEPLVPTQDEQYVFKGLALDRFQPDPHIGFIRQIQVIQWPHEGF